MARSQFEEGWTAHHKKLVEMIDARYQPGDLLWIELHDIAEKLKKPQKPVVKESLTVAEPQKLNFMQIYIEEHTKNFGVRYTPQIGAKGQWPDVGGLGMLKGMFRPDEQKLFVKVVRTFFKDMDREMAGDGRGYSGKGWLLYLLPSRVNRYMVEIAAQAEDEPDEKMTANANDSVSVEKYTELVRSQRESVEKYTALAKSHNALIDDHKKLLDRVNQRDTDTRRAAKIDGLAAKFPDFVDADEEKKAREKAKAEAKAKARRR